MKRPWLVALALGGTLTLMALGCGAGRLAPAAPPVPAVATVEPTPTVAPTATVTAVPTATATATPTFTPTPTATPAPVGKTLSGQALWGASPVAGARIELRKPGATAPVATAVVTAVADAKGQFTFDKPPVGDFTVAAVWPDGQASQGVTPPVQITANQALTGFNLKLEKLLKLLEPAAGATVKAPVTLRWEPFAGAVGYQVLVVDAVSSEPVVNQAFAGPAVIVNAVNAGRKYSVDIAALNADKLAIARVRTDFTVAGANATPAPGVAGASLPPSCQTRDPQSSAIYSTAEFCFRYPARFAKGELGPGQPALLGPALDQTLQPLRAMFTFEVTKALAGANLKSVVDTMAKGFPADTPAVSVRDLTVGGEPATVLEVVPGQFGSRDVVTLHGGRVFRLLFMPSVKDNPRVKTDVEDLFSEVTASFTFLQ